MGITIVAITHFTNSTELLNWDTQSMLNGYFILQFMPFLYLRTSGLKYQQMMRNTHKPVQKSASLQRTNILNFVTPGWLVATAITFIIYVVTVIYVTKNPFPGFAGYWNILFVLLLNIFYFTMAQRLIVGKKMDPHQSHEDRMNQTRLVVKLFVLACIACNLFLTINMGLSLLDLRHIGDIIQSLYFSLVGVMVSRLSVYEPENYDVYRASTE